MTSTDRIYQKLNYTNALAETTAFVSVKDMGEWGLIYQSTDSAAVDFVITGRNSVVQGVTSTFADSLVTTADAGSQASRVMKDPLTNRFPNEDQIKISAISRASSSGTTAGRILRIWIYYKKP